MIYEILYKKTKKNTWEAAMRFEYVVQIKEKTMKVSAVENKRVQKKKLSNFHLYHAVL